MAESGVSDVPSYSESFESDLDENQPAKSFAASQRKMFSSSESIAEDVPSEVPKEVPSILVHQATLISSGGQSGDSFSSPQKKGGKEEVGGSPQDDWKDSLEEEEQDRTLDQQEPGPLEDWRPEVDQSFQTSKEKFKAKISQGEDLSASQMLSDTQISLESMMTGPERHEDGVESRENPEIWGERAELVTLGDREKPSNEVTASPSKRAYIISREREESGSIQVEESMNNNGSRETGNLWRLAKELSPTTYTTDSLEETGNQSSGLSDLEQKPTLGHSPTDSIEEILGIGTEEKRSGLSASQPAGTRLAWDRESSEEADWLGGDTKGDFLSRSSPYASTSIPRGVDEATEIVAFDHGPEDEYTVDKHQVRSRYSVSVYPGGKEAEELFSSTQEFAKSNPFAVFDEEEARGERQTAAVRQDSTSKPPGKMDDLIGDLLNFADEDHLAQSTPTRLLSQELFARRPSEEARMRDQLSLSFPVGKSKELDQEEADGNNNQGNSGFIREDWRDTWKHLATDTGNNQSLAQNRVKENGDTEKDDFFNGPAAAEQDLFDSFQSKKISATAAPHPDEIPSEILTKHRENMHASSGDQVENVVHSLFLTPEGLSEPKGDSFEKDSVNSSPSTPRTVMEAGELRKDPSGDSAQTEEGQEEEEELPLTPKEGGGERWARGAEDDEEKGEVVIDPRSKSYSGVFQDLADEEEAREREKLTLAASKSNPFPETKVNHQENRPIEMVQSTDSLEDGFVQAVSRDWNGTKIDQSDNPFQERVDDDPFGGMNQDASFTVHPGLLSWKEQQTQPAPSHLVNGSQELNSDAREAFFDPVTKDYADVFDDYEKAALLSNENKKKTGESHKPSGPQIPTSLVESHFNNMQNEVSKSVPSIDDGTFNNGAAAIGFVNWHGGGAEEGEGSDNRSFELEKNENWKNQKGAPSSSFEAEQAVGTSDSAKTRRKEEFADKGIPPEVLKEFEKVAPRLGESFSFAPQLEMDKSEEQESPVPEKIEQLNEREKQRAGKLAKWERFSLEEEQDSNKDSLPSDRLTNSNPFQKFDDDAWGGRKQESVDEPPMVRKYFRPLEPEGSAEEIEEEKEKKERKYSQESSPVISVSESENPTPADQTPVDSSRLSPRWETKEDEEEDEFLDELDELPDMLASRKPPGLDTSLDLSGFQGLDQERRKRRKERIRRRGFARRRKEEKPQLCQKRLFSRERRSLQRGKLARRMGPTSKGRTISRRRSKSCCCPATLCRAERRKRILLYQKRS